MATGTPLNAPSAFEKRERAAEEVWFRQEERVSMLKRLEKLVAAGKLDKSVLDEVKKAVTPDPHHAASVEVQPGVFKDVPAEVKVREHVYEMKPGAEPPPKLSETERMKMGFNVDMGPSKWNPGGGESVFSLRDPVVDAAVPGRVLPEHEAARLARIAAKTGEAPTVMGVRLGSGMPRRTLVLGSILAIWGTVALVAASARGLGPGAGTPEEQAARRAAGPSALGETIANIFTPWRNRVVEHRATRAEVEAEEHAFVRALKQRMIEGRA